MESLMNTTEKELTYTITELPPMGYGNPDSAISYKKKIENGELRGDIDNAAQEHIANGECMVEVHEHDDGCIDGRCSQKVYWTSEELEVLRNDNIPLFVNEEGELYSSDNHERAKVAGGGYITSLAIRLGVDRRGESIDTDLTVLGADLAEKGIHCGAHTGAHMKGEGTDCGANDRMREILQNAVVHKEQLEESARVLLGIAGLTFNEEIFNSVINNWSDAAGDDSYFGESTGKSRLQAVLATQEAVNKTDGDAEKPAAVTKHLKGDHNEAYIVVNYVEGKTFGQNTLLQRLRDDFPGVPDEQLPQAFVADAWRIVELAQNAVEENETEAGIYAGVIYQIATAATLTDGSLRISAVTK